MCKCAEAFRALARVRSGRVCLTELDEGATLDRDVEIRKIAQYPIDELLETLFAEVILGDGQELNVSKRAWQGLQQG